ncbi:hypothetical protein LLG10_05120 [bacterium]|nr:hypothetical protein [bacterium]
MINENRFVLIHVSEIYLKSTYVKSHLQKVLLSRITDKLNRLGISYHVHGWNHNACLISGKFSEASLKMMALTFGVSYVAPVILTETNFASIRSAMQEIRSKWVGNEPKSYRITAHKDKRLSLSHYSIEYEASYYFENWQVNLKNPELNIDVDLKTDRTAIFYRRIEGAGGLPYGTQGKVIVLASKGIDSPVAAYLLAKRGCEVILLHFGEEPLNSLQLALEIYAGRSVKLITLPHTPLLQWYQENFNAKYQCIFCKLSMLTLAGHIAEQLHAKAVVTGDNLGQVASQTLDNLSLLEQTTRIPIFRPLIGQDKQEIVDLSRKIGFFPFFQNEKCAFVPVQPATTMKKDTFSRWLEEIGFESIIQDYIQKYWKKPAKTPK